MIDNVSATEAQSKVENATEAARAQSLGGRFFDDGTWKPATFETRGLTGPISRTGHTRGVFGIAHTNNQTHDWGIFHLPTGLAFPYSYSSRTRRAARAFADALLEIENWQDVESPDRKKRFFAALHDTAAAQGLPAYELHRIT